MRSAASAGGRVCSLLCAASLVVVGACGTSSGQSNEEVVVFAASSLTEAFSAMKPVFEQEHPNVTLEFNFLSSSELALQIRQGAPSDVFASADETNMNSVLDEGLASGDPRVFVGNTLAIVVAPGNPEGIENLADLEDPSLVISLCAKECPAGRYALQTFAKADVSLEPDSLESEVKAVVTRIAVGEADAGIAYVTDVRAADGEVEGVDIPVDDNVVARYPIVALEGASEGADDFIEFVLSDAGQQILEDHGFVPN